MVSPEYQTDLAQVCRLVKNVTIIGTHVSPGLVHRKIEVVLAFQLVYVKASVDKGRMLRSGTREDPYALE